MCVGVEEVLIHTPVSHNQHSCGLPTTSRVKVTSENRLNALPTQGREEEGEKIREEEEEEVCMGVFRREGGKE
ncbi:hypothetical protein E2C01_051530 [Portunus trituberculatus]|uniref:Uncharacterized protein n=1 Tax=Portunus trituberculatus TaxID=210409 RepID=A0A5B7GJT0_PORTR|nr:hypothetical protein [Portunus trituberculatus]